MECPNCKHCIISGSSPPTGENDSTAIPPVAAPPEEIPEKGPVVQEEEDLKGPKVPCVVCFVPVAAPDPADKYKKFDPVTPEEKECDELFQWFLLNFRVEPISGKIKKGSRREVKSWMDRFDQIINKHSLLGWDGEGGKSYPLPFCEECKCEVNGLMEMKNSFKKLTKGNQLNISRKGVQMKVKEGIFEVARKMRGCEVEFFKSGIYEKDKRYHRVRNGIFKLHWKTTSKLMKKESAPPPPPPQRRPEVVVVEVPCIICCKTLKIFPEAEKTMKKKAEDMRVFRWFLNHLQNPLGQVLFSWNNKHLKKKGTNEFWDGLEGKSEPLQFCGGCRDGILNWIDVRNTAQMYKARAKEIRMMKERMRECEDEFERSGIYRKDRRYFNVRRKVIKLLEVDYPEKPKVVLPPPPQMKKKVKRRVERNRKLFEKNEMDRILGEGFGGHSGEQVEFVVKGEGDDEKDWQWEGEEDDEVDEEEEPPMEFEEDDDLGEDPLGFGTEPEDSHVIRVKMEQDSVEPESGALEFENEIPHRNCLLCYKAISKKESALAPVLTNDLNEQNFNSVFILRKMLNVPEIRLVGYLENFGCPGKWVEYCTNCLGLVDQALRIQKEINELEKKLRGCQEKMVLKIKSTSRKKKNRSLDNSEITQITEEARQFVSGPSPCGKRMKKNVIRRQVAPVVVAPPEVTMEDNEDNYGPLESPDDQDFDPSYMGSDSDSDDEAMNLNPISAKKIIKPSLKKDKKVNFSAKVKVSCRDTGKRFLENFKRNEYTCTLCPNMSVRQKHMSLDRFYRHLIFHSQRPFKCTICNVYWSSSKELLENNPFPKETHSSDHVCTEATLVKVPNEKYYLGEIWSCKWCPLKFVKETERDSHEDHLHGSFKTQLEMEFKCLSCSKGYRSYREWLFHRVLEHPQIAGISCLFCDYSAVIKTKEGIDILDWMEMKRHTNLEHSACKKLLVSPYICDFCGLPCKYKTMDLTVHIKRDHKLTNGLSTYSCPCCYYRIDRLRGLKMHLHLRHSLDPPNYVAEEKDDMKICNVCGKEGIRSEVTLMDHKMRKHGMEPEEMEEYTGQEIIKCGRWDECGFRTLIRKNLGVHMRNRHGAKRKKEKFESGDEEDDMGPSSLKKVKFSREKCSNVTLNEDEFTCSLCPSLELPMSLGKFYRHLIFHMRRPFKCSVCNIYWGSAKELENNPFDKDNPSREHICCEATLVRILPENGKFDLGEIWKCKWCDDDRKFGSEMERDSHEMEEHSSRKFGLEMEYKCLSCSKGYRSHEEWLLHRISEHPEIAGISCLFCDYTAVIKTKEGAEIFDWVQMGKHVGSEHSSWANKNLYFGYHDYCDFCGVTFRYGQPSLAQHIKEDHKLTSGDATYSCDLCYHRCGKLRNLRLHFNRSHSHDPRPPCKRPGYPGRITKVVCDICGNSLMGRVPLCDHKMNKHGIKLEEMEEYKGEKLLICEKAEECGGFGTLLPRFLKDHMAKKHGGERRWRCDQCGKGFTDGRKLSAHKEIHKGVKPYQCEICGNSFAVKNYLYIHKRLSHQNRPFASTNRKRTTKRPSAAAKSGQSTVFPPTQPAAAQNSMESFNSANCNINAMDLGS